MRLAKALLMLLFWVPQLHANDAELDQRLLQMSQQKQAVVAGETLFQQICASCHGKDLSGGSGFNLKDAQWVHGGRPSEILHNVKTGFLNAGMPGFGMMFKPQELENIVAYILSKKQGWDALAYRLYQLEDENDKTIVDAKLIKSGRLEKGLADFSIPEVRHYYIEFEGDFYAPTDQDSQIWLEWGFPHEVFMYVDGALVKRGGKPWYPTWRLKRGKQKLKITYRSGTTKINQRNLVLLGTNLDLTVKLFAVSTKAKAILDSKSFEVKATTKPIIQRKRILELPPSTISVGLPQKLNFGFNTKSCAIVGVWQGELLNIGPNIAGRGEDPSLPLGDWVVKPPQQIGHQRRQQDCRYLGYQIDNGFPIFHYQISQIQYHLRVTAPATGVLHLTYESQSGSLGIVLPELLNAEFNRNGQPLSTGEHSFTSKQQNQITLTIKLNGQ